MQTTANPFSVRVISLTVVTADFDASTRFYRDIFGYPVEGEAILDGKRIVFARHPGQDRGIIRLIEASAGARPNRDGARPWDPGLLGTECQTPDADDSYRHVTAAGVRTISPPLPYFFHGLDFMTDLDVKSYALFGPAGEEIYVTQNTGPNRRPFPFAGRHGVLGSAIVRCLDAKPVWDFYNAVFDVLPGGVIPCQQENVDEVIGAPRGTYFDWGGIAGGIEWQAFRMPEGTIYPTSLDRTGAAMFTMEVSDLAGVRERCRRAGIEPIAEGALPLPGRTTPAGFVLRGADGERIEVVEALAR